jgi:protein-L-isoaspartate(D-aspartate) O-methyltransferase
MDTIDPSIVARRRMIFEQIHSRGIKDPRVLAAMEFVPREEFVPASTPEAALSDRALPIDCGQTISQPYMVASMTALLDVRPEHRVLEIGTGSGYQTAILAHLAGQVYTVERLPDLLEAARGRLERLGFSHVAYRLGDGTAGWPEEAPFDRILVTAGAPEPPRSLVEQLVEGGRLVIPVGGEKDQTLTLLEKLAGRIRETPQFSCRFVKLIGREGWSEGVHG